MRAIVVTAHGGPEVLALQDVPTPEAGPGQVLVAVETAGVNYRDVYERVGGGYAPGAPPFVAGIEGAGTVQAVGADVQTVAVGDRVAWVGRAGQLRRAAGRDADKLVRGARGRLQRGRGRGAAAGHHRAVPGDEHLPGAEGDTVVVHAAAGGVGLLLTQIVKLRGGHVDRDDVDAREGRARARGRRRRGHRL